jgi:hypothetical protein
MVINRGLNHSSYKEVSPMTHLFIILSSINVCMAYLTLVPLL